MFVFIVGVKGEKLWNIYVCIINFEYYDEDWF